MKTHYLIDSPVGCLTCVVSEGALTRLWVGDSAPAGTDIGVEAPLRWFDLENQFTNYFSGRSTSFDVETHITGTTFQQRVWAHVQSIPYGEQQTYRQVAEALGDPYRARAVGQAIATHPIPIIFPGHRVVRAGSDPYASTEKMFAKKRLLQLEWHYTSGGSHDVVGAEWLACSESA